MKYRKKWWFLFLGLGIFSYGFLAVPAEVKAVTNLVPNASLEIVSSYSPNNPEAWYWDFYGTNTRIFTYPVAGYLGGKAIQVNVNTHSNGDAKWFFEPVSVTPGNTYTFSDFYQSNTSSIITLQYGLTGGGFIYKTLGTAAASPDWASFSASFTVPSNVAKVSVFHRLTSVGSLTTDEYSLVDNADVNEPPIPPTLPPLTPPTLPPTPPIPPTSPQVPITRNNCMLKLILASNTSSVKQGDKVTYAMNVQNQGAAACQNTSISLYYSDNEKFISADPRPSASNYYWIIGSLASGTQKNFTIITQASQTTSTNIHTEGCVTANNGQDACVSNDITISNELVPVPPVMPPTPPTPPTPSPTPPVPPTPPPTAPVTPAAKDYGAWVWVSPAKMSSSYRNSLINSAKANNINVLYVTIDDYLNIATMPAGPAKQTALANYNSSIDLLLQLAAQNNISIDAEAGSYDWALPENTWKAQEILKFVAGYNQSHGIKFRGVQYDIEPYILPYYESNKAEVLTEYVQMVKGLVNTNKSLNMPLTMIIPHFYDNLINWTPSITVDSIRAHTYTHLLRLLGEVPNNNIIVMAYRNFAQGKNGAIDISNTEINQAIGTNIKILVAQEAGPFPPDFITFYDTSRSYYESQIAIINNTFDSKSSFNGIAIHSFDTFLQLP